MLVSAGVPGLILRPPGAYANSLSLCRPLRGLSGGPLTIVGRGLAVRLTIARETGLAQIDLGKSGDGLPPEIGAVT